MNSNNLNSFCIYNSYEMNISCNEVGEKNQEFHFDIIIELIKIEFDFFFTCIYISWGQARFSLSALNSLVCGLGVWSYETNLFYFEI